MIMPFCRGMGLVLTSNPGLSGMTLISRAALRRLGGCALALMLPLAPALAQTPSPQARAPQNAEQKAQGEFRRFLDALWQDARAQCVSRATFDAALKGASPDAKIVALTKKQSEFVQPIWGYLGGAVGGERIGRGREVAAEWAAVLDGIERTYGVPRSVVLGVWGMETNYGGFTGNLDVFRSLATLAFAQYRGDFFRKELLTALRILEDGRANRAAMRGSWAGAMGHTQFMPSSYLKFAVDGDGDGRADIWASIPDALASTANYLRQHGWQPGLPWGFEVALPEGFDFRTQRQAFSGWSGLGVRRADGNPMPATGEAALFLPAGARGPAFLVTANYDVIKTYNSSDAYALGVAHLGDRVFGGAAIRGAWPRSEPMLNAFQRQEIQRRLAELGFYTGNTDGKFGSMTREAVRAFQLHRGILPDGYADMAVLEHLREVR
jgi:membrane-bound lytic murein transglycosylase B